ncbi:hypothetical protein ENHYD8BJ_80207 [Enhydrobacter sp. 8BJ]|nr:hypothetical protein ENHYD8BJ_80207 [Enhydrobacter sp. 8BJ]
MVTTIWWLLFGNCDYRQRLFDSRENKSATSLAEFAFK